LKTLYLHRMKAEQNKQVESGITAVIACLLCFCLFVTNFSFYLKHSHSSESLCHKSNSIIESDPCHIRLYHDVHSIKACEHTKHIRKQIVECELCKVLQTQLQTDQIKSERFTILRSEFTTSFPEYSPSIIVNSIGGTSNKGPPLFSFHS
jgi:hypothetical protein